MRGLWRIERKLRAEGLTRIAGVDEAGCGPLAGPIVAAAAMLPPGCRLPGLADSKLLNAGKRDRLFELIQKKATAVGIGIADARTVDRVNVYRAARHAMGVAAGQLDPPAEMLLVDGRGLASCSVPQRTVVGGDRICGSIAAASIIAKVVRDRIMLEIHERYPGYGFARHKGYGTREHRMRLSELGPCPEHRLSFAPVREMLQGRLWLEGRAGRQP